MLLEYDRTKEGTKYTQSTVSADLDVSCLVIMLIFND